LAQSVDDVCAKLGFEREERKFRPHLTIARLREPEASRELADAHRRSAFESKVFPIKEIALYESKLLPSGSIYSTLAAFSLGGN
jgi:2'-5' RNA ligase